MKNEKYYLAGIILVIVLLLFGWKIVGVNIGPIGIELEAPDKPQLQLFDNSLEEQTVIEYWNNIDKENFDIAWESLSSKFQQNNHNSDYNDYYDGYQDMEICSVDVKNVTLKDSGDNQAIVFAHIIYRVRSNCIAAEYDFDHFLVFDNSKGKWLLDVLKKR